MDRRATHITSFEELLAELSASLIHVDPQMLDSKIEAALGSILKSLDLDRSTLAVFHGESLRVTHSSAIEGLSPFPAHMDLGARLPHLIASLRKCEIYAMDTIADLPEQAKVDRDTASHLGVKSALVVPLIRDGAAIGGIGFVSIRREKSFPSELKGRLKLIAGIFTNALGKRESDRQLRDAFAEIRTLKEEMEQENQVWRDEASHLADAHEVVGSSAAFQNMMELGRQVAPLDTTVLILGETGTGKDLLAGRIHLSSARADRPLVRVNCATLPATLIESELFGHEKGAFSGAVSARPGRFELADRGTIVLEEVGELPLDLQAKLLRVLQTGEFERLGSSETQRTDVRVIASTNRELERMVAAGTFRSDLYYRLRVFPITVPPLRERREDVPMLTAYQVERLRARLGRRIRRIPQSTIDRLTAYDWPGNVRELQNVIERSMILSPGDELVVDDLLPQSSLAPHDSPRVPSSPPDEVKTLAALEREHIRSVCELCGWKVHGEGNAAERLGINPSTLRSRMKKLGVTRPL